MSSHRFLALAAATAVGLCLLSALLTVAVDPYRIYGTPTVPGWTALKPWTDTHQFSAKLDQLERIRPNTLLLGNSRVEVGFDPQSREWRNADRPVYNAALSGRGLRAALDLLRDAVAVHPPKTVLLGLDFVDFLQKPDRLPAPPPPIRADERRLLVDREGRPNPARRLQKLRDLLTTTLNIDAVLDALATLFDQNPHTSATVTPLGFNPRNQYRVFVREQGYYALFSQKNQIYLREYKDAPAPDFSEPLRYASFRDLAKIMTLCQARKIRLILFIHPYHADFLDILHKDGLWRSFLAWKRALVRVATAGMPAGSPAPALFDFSGYNRFTTEPVPPPGDRRTAMHWYWESGHYKSALGDRMLARILNGTPGFGVALVGTTINVTLRGHRAVRVGRGGSLP